MFAMERVPGTLLSLEMFSSWVRGRVRGRVGVGLRGRVGVRIRISPGAYSRTSHHD